MLVLSRRVGEEIVLPGRGVKIIVLGISGTRVRLGIVAPPEEPVYRAELWKRKLDAESCEKDLIEARKLSIWAS